MIFAIRHCVVMMREALESKRDPLSCPVRGSHARRLAEAGAKLFSPCGAHDLPMIGATPTTEHTSPAPTKLLRL